LKDNQDHEDIRLDEALINLKERLGKVSETAGLDAQVLLAHVTGKPRSWVLAHADECLQRDASRRLAAAVERLEQGEPLPYVLGQWEFYGLKFIITPAVLIPRPETEILVEFALDWLVRKKNRIRAVDAGTGSGCIAVALAVNNPLVQVLAADISWDALQVAAQNIKRHAVMDRVLPIQSDLLAPVGTDLDLVCANLPYIPDETLKGLDVYHREPTLALSGGKEGLTLIHRFLEEAAKRLNLNGLVLAEIEANQGKPAANIAQQYFPEDSIKILKDYSGHDRLLAIERK
jgi:release factor glutamine methyltransferase